MEFLLLWWDELDDLTHACRHLASCAIAEAAVRAVPLANVAWGLGAAVFAYLTGQGT